MPDAIQFAARAVQFRGLARKEAEPRRARMLIETSLMFEAMAKSLRDREGRILASPMPVPALSRRTMGSFVQTLGGAAARLVMRPSPKSIMASPLPRLQRA